MNLIFPKIKQAENNCSFHSFEQRLIGADSVLINSETLVLCSEAAEDISLNANEVLQSNCCCLFFWRYNPLWFYFHSPVAGFSLLIFRVFLITHNDAPQLVRTSLDE